MAYEGLEESPNIIYTGAAPDQQVIPAVKWSFDRLKARKYFLAGSDYIWPHAVNAIAHDYLAGAGGRGGGRGIRPLRQPGGRPAGRGDQAGPAGRRDQHRGGRHERPVLPQAGRGRARAQRNPGDLLQHRRGRAAAPAGPGHGRRLRRLELLPEPRQRGEPRLRPPFQGPIRPRPGDQRRDRRGVQQRPALGPGRRGGRHRRRRHRDQDGPPPEHAAPRRGSSRSTRRPCTPGGPSTSAGSAATASSTSSGRRRRPSARSRTPTRGRSRSGRNSWTSSTGSGTAGPTRATTPAPVPAACRRRGRSHRPPRRRRMPKRRRPPDRPSDPIRSASDTPAQRCEPS